MTNLGGTDATLRGKRLHPEMTRRVMERYASRHYEDAVLAAFKVIEERLRDITGKSDALIKELLHDTFHPTAGTLQDPHAWGSEREGVFLLLRAAFASFRDRRAHEFVDTDAEAAFDLIVLANRMLLLIEEGQQHTQTQPTAPSPSLGQPLLYVDASGGVHVDEVYEKGRYVLDADNDGEPELLVWGRERHEVFRVFKYVEGNIQRFEVERAAEPFTTRDILLADVDNDSQQEVVCITYFAYNNAVLFYKYRNGRYELLKKDPQAATREHHVTPEGHIMHSFPAAHIADINDDGQVEVVSEPKAAGYAPPPVRYVWKWNENEGVFNFLYKEGLT